MADHRLRLSTSHMGAFIAQIGSAILKKKGISGPLASQLATIGASFEVDKQWIDACATDLTDHAGQSIIIAGEHLPKSVHAIVIALNQIISAPVNYLEIPPLEQGISAAVSRLNEGSVQTLILLGGNPAYDSPVDLNWAKAQAQAKQSIYIGTVKNETAEAADLFVARSHYLESWGDGRTFDGTLVPVQPMIEPLFETFSELEILARLSGAAETDGYSIARATFAALGGKNYEKFLSDGVLKDSAFPVASAVVDYASVAILLKTNEFVAPELSVDAVEVRFVPNSHTYDGRYANNGWMMECPDPITKLTWDNAILISPSLARKLESKYGVQIFPEKKPMNEDSAFFEGAKGTQQINKAKFNRGKEIAVVAKLTVNGLSLKAPIHVVPGMADYTIALPLGMGREKVGRVGQGVGFNAYTVRTSDKLGYVSGATLELTEETYRLANTQEHWSMEGRALIRENTAAGYAKTPDFASKMGVESHAPANYGKSQEKSLQEKSINQYRGNSAYEHVPFKDPAPNVKVWKGHEDEFPVPQQWGMAIDLNSCTSCNACVVACQSENNVPIVGKEQVLRGREMHWLRLDRYFSAETYNQSEVPDDVQVSFMGMMCQHCENAPCEQVCPVNATVHDTSGLNTMAYNRCVGTRYCANNCPYKVRRFNFFDWNKRKIGEFYKGPLGPVEEPELEKMRANPNVTIRMRGVMEKCTFCTQRIESAKIEQKRLAKDSGNVRVPDGNIKTACQQVCPTDAITFGDISDADTEVSKMKASDRNYSVLGYLNVRPRTTYLARLRNPNPAMPDAYKKPYTYAQYKARYGHDSHGAGQEPAHHGDHEDNSSSVKKAPHTH
jgi:molybdopterin-containing oxidoreductase family iron-sulfur binding subunit